jgi:hypothetical protein
MTIKKGRTGTENDFVLGDRNLDSTDNYKYLGTIINNKGSLLHAQKELENKGMKALFSVMKAITHHKSPDLNLATKLYNSMIKPITLYNHEIWGADIPNSVQKLLINGSTTMGQQDKLMKFINESPAEQLHLKFNKLVLGVGRHSSNIGVRSETGNYPLIIETCVAIVKYWRRLHELPKDRLARDALLCNMDLHKQGTFTWTSFVECILRIADFTEVWDNPLLPLPTKFYLKLQEALKEKYILLFAKVIFNDNRPGRPGARNKLRTYRLFETNHDGSGLLKDPDPGATRIVQFWQDSGRQF